MKVFPFTKVTFDDGMWLDLPGEAYEAVVRALGTDCAAVEIDMPGGSRIAISTHSVYTVGLYRTPLEREAAVKWAAARSEWEEGLCEEVWPERAEWEA